MATTTPWECDKCGEHNSASNTVCSNCGDFRTDLDKEAGPTLGQLVDEALDELADLSEIWQRWRAEQRTPKYIRAAILTVTVEVAELVLAAESSEAGDGTATAPPPAPLRSEEDPEASAPPEPAATPEEGSPPSAQNVTESEREPESPGDSILF